MLGAIAGDTIGSVYEFNNTRDYNFPLLTGRSSYTDDTIMTIAVAYWLMNDPDHTLQGLEDSLVMFGHKYDCPMGGYGGGFRTWLFDPESLFDYDATKGELPYISTTGRHPYFSWGNGSAMRASACGWWADSLEETLRFARLSAIVTHNHPEGIKGAQATAAAIYLARNGRSKSDIKSYIEKTFGYDLDRAWEHLHRTYRWDSSCQGTVPEAMIAFLESTDFEDAIRKAVSMGGDSDTLACITGSIAEAFYGGVPCEIADFVLRQIDEISWLFNQFAAVCSYNQVLHSTEETVRQWRTAHR